MFSINKIHVAFHALSELGFFLDRVKIVQNQSCPLCSILSSLVILGWSSSKWLPNKKIRDWCQSNGKMRCYIPIVNKTGLDTELLQQPNDLSMLKCLALKHNKQQNLSRVELKQDTPKLLLLLFLLILPYISAHSVGLFVCVITV